MKISGLGKVGGLESAVFVFAALMAAEIILWSIPGFASVDVIIAIRLSLLGVLSVVLGYWLQRRYVLQASAAALSFAIGVGASYLLRSLRDAGDGHGHNEEISLLVGVAAIQWAVLLVGAAIGMWRHSRTPAKELSTTTTR